MVSYTSKERVVILEDQNQESKICVGWDFLELTEYIGNSSERVAENEKVEAEVREKDVNLDLYSKRVDEKEEIMAENRGKKPKDGILDPSYKMVAENEKIHAEIGEKELILDLSCKTVAENEQIQVENIEKEPKDGILDLSCKRVVENEEIQTEIGGKQSKFGTLDLSLALPSSSSIQQLCKRVAQNEEIHAEITEKSVILDISTKRVAENEEVQTENREKARIFDLSAKRVAENEEIQTGNREKAGILDNEEIRAEIRGKKPKFGTLDLSLYLPSSSSSRQSLEPSNDNTRIGYFRNGSLSSCYSHPFSHNLSYSLTLSSSKDSEYSGERLNWSVFSQFRPVEGGDFRLTSHSHGTSLALGCRLQVNKDNDIDRISSSDSNPFVLFELPARPTGDSKVSGSTDGGRALELYQPKRILREIVSESVPFMAQIVQELPDETVESTKEYLRSLIAIPEKDFFVSLQNRLNQRSDLTIETLSECNKTQLEFFVAIKMGHISFLSLENHLQATELIEIFSLERCRNICCKRVLPVVNCKCKICSRNKGFCSECMCQVCFNFDYASNTFSWIGCDRCSHWCHAVCAVQRNFIKPGPSINGPSGTTEMQFHCLGCGHPSEMFGFARDVYLHCAKGWSEETLIEELGYVRKFFDGSEDFKGKELHAITCGLCNKLEKKMISPSDACDFIFHFFKYTDGLSQFLSSSFPACITLLTKSSFNIMGSSNGTKGMITVDHHQDDAKDPSKSDKMIGDICSAIKER
ncbi:putative purple acid phosphatase 3-like [Capsicum annuum]|uniref:protein OBERON 3 isoform X1 n=1 Tax=Capsicum annuum TaxID=4072 RepID=UPI001FB098A5|nr:protein OBERON 3 isoform X1 [Capsicum annuum]KAF3668927.1 putative purple acid phosphatase 3-like [Capsicum annuum]